MPASVRTTLSAALAIPKSEIFTSPWRASRMFCGETSRWTMVRGRPFASERVCAWCRPAAASEMMWATTSGGRLRPRSETVRSSDDKGTPSTHSITR